MNTRFNKVAEVTVYFWIVKLCATVLGETAGDLLSMTLNLGYAASSAILFGLFAVAVSIQLMADRYRPVLYWFVILTTLTAGTTISDMMDRTLGLGYANGSLLLLTLLGCLLVVWRLSQKSLSVSSIRTRKAEVLYWSAILVSNTLGTALGDFLADDSGLGFMGGALLTGAMLALIAGAYYMTSVNRVALFWGAFILTRPFGATFGDVLTKTRAQGGLNFGTINASLVLFTLLVGLVTYGALFQQPAHAIAQEPELEEL